MRRVYSVAWVRTDGLTSPEVVCQEPEAAAAVVLSLLSADISNVGAVTVQIRPAMEGE